MTYAYQKNGNIPPSEQYFNHTSLAIAWPRVVARYWTIHNDIDRIAQYIVDHILSSNEGDSIASNDIDSIQKNLVRKAYDKHFLKDSTTDSKWLNTLLSKDSDSVISAFVQEGLANCKPDIGDANFFQRFYQAYQTLLENSDELKTAYQSPGLSENSSANELQQAWYATLTPNKAGNMWDIFKQHYYQLIGIEDCSPQAKILSNGIDQAIANAKAYFITSEVFVKQMGESFDLTINAYEGPEDYGLYNADINVDQNGWEDAKGLDHTVVYSLPLPPNGEGDLGLALADYAAAGKTYVFTSS